MKLKKVLLLLISSLLLTGCDVLEALGSLNQNGGSSSSEV